MLWILAKELPCETMGCLVYLQKGWHSTQAKVMLLNTASQCPRAPHLCSVRAGHYGDTAMEDLFVDPVRPEGVFQLFASFRSVSNLIQR